MITEKDIDNLIFRVSLANTDEDFERVVRKLLVFAIKFIALYEEHRKKLMQLLNIITRRLKANSKLQLPVRDLFVCYNDQEKNTFLMNFSYLYLDIGFPRLSVQDKIACLTLLYASLTEDKPIFQRTNLLHLTLPVLESLTLLPKTEYKIPGWTDIPYQRRFMHEFYTLLILLPYDPRLSEIDLNTQSCPVDGFSAHDLARITSKTNHPEMFEVLEKYKVAIVNFYSMLVFSPSENIVPLIFANADQRHSVVSAAAKELRTLSMLVDWEDEELLSHLLTWYLGRRREFDPAGHAKKPRNPLSVNVRIKMTPFLLRSRITLPGPLVEDLLAAIILSLNSYSSLLQVANRKKVTAASNTTDPHAPVPIAPDGSPLNPEQNTLQQNAVRAGNLIRLKKLAEHSLDLFQHLVTYSRDLPPNTAKSALNTLVGFVLEKSMDELAALRCRGLDLLARFLSRNPDYLLAEPIKLAKIFSLLNQDDCVSDVQKAAAHCLKCLAHTLQVARDKNYPALKSQLNQLERLLYEIIDQPYPLGRMTAVYYASVIYPCDHIGSRYLILQALSDPDSLVRDLAVVSFTQFLEPQVAQDIAYGRVKVPKFIDFVNHDRDQARENPFVQVSRLMPVVRFIRLCLLGAQGGLSPYQETEMTYENEDEIRYRINQNVRFFLAGHCQEPIPEPALVSQPRHGSEDEEFEDRSETPSSGAAATPPSERVFSSSASASSSESTKQSNNRMVPLLPSLNALDISLEKKLGQARRSIDTYFRLTQVVVFAGPSFLEEQAASFVQYLEEVLANNTQDLYLRGNQVFERMTGSKYKHACASVYSIVTMETCSPERVLDNAGSMFPDESAALDDETAQCFQGLYLGVAYLLERFFTKHVKHSVPENYVLDEKSQAATTTTASKSKRDKKQKNKSSLEGAQSATFRDRAFALIYKFLSSVDSWLVKPSSLVQAENKKDKSLEGKYVNSRVAIDTMCVLLEAIAVMAQAGCFAYLSASHDSTKKDADCPPLTLSKHALASRIYKYLPPTLPVNELETFTSLHMSAIKALAAICMGQLEHPMEAPNPIVGDRGVTLLTMDALIGTQNHKDLNFNLRLGEAMADVLIGPYSAYKGHWYERTYPLRPNRDKVISLITTRMEPNDNGNHSFNLAAVAFSHTMQERLARKPGQVATRPETISASLWAFSIISRLGWPLELISVDSIIGLLSEDDANVRCIGVACLGMIYDWCTDEAQRSEIIGKLSDSVLESGKGSAVSHIYRELARLAKQIGRPDLLLSLVLIAMTPLNQILKRRDVTGSTSVEQINITIAEACSSLIRRLGRGLAPALPRLVSRVYIRLFDSNRPALRQAMENLWCGLVLFAFSPSSSQFLASSVEPNLEPGKIENPANLTSSVSRTSYNSLATSLIGAHFNAIVCEIKVQLGLNALKSQDESPSKEGSVGEQSRQLRDCCCKAIVNLTVHPNADKELAGHLPTILAGLFAIIEEEKGETHEGSAYSAAEYAAIAVEKMVINVLENPVYRQMSSGLLPGLLQVLIEKTLVAGPESSDASQALLQINYLALDLLLAAARTAPASVLKPSLSMLILTSLHNMAHIPANRVVAIIRHPVVSPGMFSQQPVDLGVQKSSAPNRFLLKECQLAEILRLCLRLVTDSTMTDLLPALTDELKSVSSPSVTVAVCVFIVQLCNLKPKSPELNMGTHSSKLLSALLYGLPNCICASNVVTSKMNETIAALLKLCKESTANKLLQRLLLYYHDPKAPVSANNASLLQQQYDLVLAHLLNTIVYTCPDVVIKQANLMLPMAFVAKQSEVHFCKSFTQSWNSLLNQSLTPSKSVVYWSMWHFVVHNSLLPVSKPDPSTELEQLQMAQTLWLEFWSESQTLYQAHLNRNKNLFDRLKTGSDGAGCHNGLFFLLQPTPLFTALVESLQNCLFNCQFWSVRTQASMAMLSLSSALLEQCPPVVEVSDSVKKATGEDKSVIFEKLKSDQVAELALIEKLTSSQMGQENQVQFCPETMMEEFKTVFACNLFSSPGVRQTWIKKWRLKKSLASSKAQEQKVVENEAEMDHSTWLQLAEITIKALKECRPWYGKAFLLRTAAILSLYAAENKVSLEAAHMDLLKTLWVCCQAETRPGRAAQMAQSNPSPASEKAESVDPSGLWYRLEAVFALAAVSRALSDAQHFDGVFAKSQSGESCNNLALLCRMIFPNGGVKRIGTLLPSSHDVQVDLAEFRMEGFKNACLRKHSLITATLNSERLETIFYVIGSIWPTNPTVKHLKLLVELLQFFVLVIKDKGLEPFLHPACFSLSAIIEKVDCVGVIDEDGNALSEEAVVQHLKEAGMEQALDELVGTLKEYSEECNKDAEICKWPENQRIRLMAMLIHMTIALLLKKWTQSHHDLLQSVFDNFFLQEKPTNTNISDFTAILSENMHP
ncbi:hypothetical protein Ciccas_005093 [Cichlidogyrus casuarinus]|uniref:Huntingtin n=1 Tax=Cichlidogyrus casuarinus TaxID=1844966 RepID=A0ABD2QAK1_9PLAT